MSVSALSVTAVLLSYNCEEFISEALWSVLDQDYRHLHILVSDDGSNDGTVQVIERELGRYRGQHTVHLNRRSHNSGSKSAHLNALFPSIVGDVVVLFDGDDISLSHRVSRLVEPFCNRKGTRAVFSAMSIMDRYGQPMRRSPVPHPGPRENATAWFAKVDSYAAGGTLAIHRAVIDAFGELDPEINEDIVLPFRASLLGAVEYVDEPLVMVRRHAGSFTTDLGQYRSMETYRARIEAGIDKARKKATLRLADITTAEEWIQRGPEEWSALRRIVDTSLADAEVTKQLLDPSRLERLAALAKVIRAGAYPEQLAGHIFLALAPSLYLRYKRYMARRKIH